MNYKIAQFILTPGQRSHSTLEIYVAQPDANKEALAGKLFVLIEIESKGASSLKIINFLINSLTHNYYQNEKMILRERVQSVKIEHIFESALAKTNKKLAEFMQAEKIKLNYELLNITIGVVFADSLHFANLGKNKALLVYRNKTEDSAKYKLADITEQTNASEPKKNPLKLFSNVVSGVVPRGGYFIFASETFSEYLSTKQIVSIVTTLPPAGAAEQIKNTLSKINSYVPFLGIIVKNTTGLEMAEVKIKEPAASTRASIENLIVTEEQTEKLLTPPGLINAKNWPSLLAGLTGRAAQAVPVKTFWLKDKIFSKRKAGLFSLGKIYNFVKTFLSDLMGLAIYIFKIITDKKAMADFFRQTALTIKNSVFGAKDAGSRLLSWYKNLSLINKSLFSGFVVCLLIFSASLGQQALKSKNLAAQAELASLTSTIEQKQNQIDASLLYNNEEGAKKIISEATGLLAKLPQNNQAAKDIYNSLFAKHQVQIEKISRVIRPVSAELANFINLNANAAPDNLILANGKLYAADVARKAIYSVETKGGLATAIDLSAQTLSRLNFPSLDKNNNIYYLGAADIKILDSKSDTLSGLSVDYGGDLQNAAGAKQYNNRFYIADKAVGQIFRFSKSGDKLTGAVAWLNAQENLAGVAGLDIDGDVYALKNNGELLKFTKGQKQDFALAPVEPALGQAAKVIVSAELDYIYIFNPSGRRIVVFDKIGKFILQYSSDKLAGAKDFEVDETGKKIYFLNDARVYWFDLTNTK